MAQFKCKMCGGTINVKDGQSSCECEFCGTTQTVPIIINNEKLVSLHNRANTLRQKNEFDKAILTYESIIGENPKDAEAHWGLLLCRYGIEYVDDPKTGTKIPTCHRTQFKPIFEDIDYKAAIENSDLIAKKIYQDEAEVINKIQKSILVVSQKEDPFDIFICYKESDENGKRTRDSVIAQEIYEELTNIGYKVFFSKITLESILGSQYEPHIFAALNSSKVMLVLGTKPEYFNAVWVKNEWARYLEIINASGQKKYLIPCYRDMDAYELPDEMLQFQAQDMGKLGFIQDLTRGINKIFGRDKNDIQQKPVSQPVIPNGIDVSKLLKRCEILIKDGDYEKAEEVLDHVFNNDPENAKAYILLIIIEYRLKKEEDIIKLRNELNKNKNFINALNYADEEYKKVLKGYLKKIEEINKYEHNSKKYNEALELLNDFQFEKAKEIFKGIIDFKDCKEKIVECDKLYNDWIEKKYKNAKENFDNYKFENAEVDFLFLSSKNYKDSEKYLEQSRLNRKLEIKYQEALKEMSQFNFDKAKEIFKGIEDYRNSKEKIVECDKLKREREITLYKLANKYYDEYDFKNASETFKLIKDYKDSYDLLLESYDLLEKENEYKNAKRFMNARNYGAAICVFDKIKKYRDSEKLIRKCRELQNYANKEKLKKGVSSFILGHLKAIFCSIVAIALIIILTCVFIYSALPFVVENGVNYKKNGDEYIAYAANASVKSINISENVRGCTVTEIGQRKHHLGEPTDLCSIYIPKSIKKINGLFKYICDIDVYYYGTLEDWFNIQMSESHPFIVNNFYMKNELNEWERLDELVLFDNISEVDSYLFDLGVEKVVIPNNIVKINKYSFSNWKNLREVEVLGGLKEIDERGFSNCENLTDIYFIENCLNKIGKEAFYGCNFQQIRLPDGLLEIGISAFAYCDNLTSIEIPGSIEKISTGAFVGTYYREIIVGQGGYYLSHGSNIEKIYYKGDKKNCNIKWGDIVVKDGKYLSDSQVYYYSSSRPSLSGNYYHYDNDGNIVEW